MCHTRRTNWLVSFRKKDFQFNLTHISGISCHYSKQTSRSVWSIESKNYLTVLFCLVEKSFSIFIQLLHMWKEKSLKCPITSIATHKLMDLVVNQFACKMVATVYAYFLQCFWCNEKLQLFVAYFHLFEHYHFPPINAVRQDQYNCNKCNRVNFWQWNQARLVFKKIQVNKMFSI